MTELPLLILPPPKTVDKRPQGGGPGNPPQLPSRMRQKTRLIPQFKQLAKAFKDRTAELRQDPTGVEPEQMLVLETVSGVDEFYKALRGLEGLEWLGEYETRSIEPDEDFQYPKETDRELYGRVYLIMSNQEGLQQLLRLWGVFKKNPEHPDFKRGYTKWRDLFSCLKDIRTWGPEDRLLDTGLKEEWERRVRDKAESVRVEIELWFRGDEGYRSQCEDSLRNLVEQAGGKIVVKALIPQIHYHAVLAELPIEHVEAIVKLEATRLVKSDNVMFFRPHGQATVSYPTDEPLSEDVAQPTPSIQGEPIVALLDGLPLENHARLSGHLIVDDPDDWAEHYPANERRHGTAMASLIIHDELDADQEPLTRPLYARPIMLPDPNDFINRPRVENMPSDELHVDLVHRAVRRLFELDGTEPAVAPAIKIINLSICDAYRPFEHILSPWARLIDFLSWNYKVLFIVSIGNHPDPLEVCNDNEDLQQLLEDGDTIQRRTVAHILNDALNRRLLSPSEGINALTVGAVHSDLSPYQERGHLIDPYTDAGLPSPVNKQGPGFRRAIKPEILTRGGRQLFRRPVIMNGPDKALSISQSLSPPGMKVAYPGLQGEINGTAYLAGTSNAAALISRRAAQLYETTEPIIRETIGDQFDESMLAVVLKALLAHNVSWGSSAEIIGAVLNQRERVGEPETTPLGNAKNLLTRLLGYGVCDDFRLTGCTDQRATMIGFGYLEKDQAFRYTLPAPPSLNGRIEWRRITVTLAWFTPTNPNNRLYRRARVWFDPYGESYKDEEGHRLKENDVSERFGVSRKDADWMAVRRGTVQHEIFEGERATSYPDESTFEIQVNCRPEQGEILDDVRIPYGLAISLEVAEEVNLPIYQEIRDRIQVPIRP